MSAKVRATQKISNNRGGTGPGALRAPPPRAARSAREEAHGAADFSRWPARSARFPPGHRAKTLGLRSFYRYRAQYQQHRAKNPHRSRRQRREATLFGDRSRQRLSVRRAAARAGFTLSTLG